MAVVQKLDSNVTGLRYAEEASFKTLPGAPVWKPLEPNSYADFGGQVALVARAPIASDRQRKKGVITDLDASGGFNMDLTQANLQDILQGFMFADLRTKDEFAIADVTGGATDAYTVKAGALSAVIAAGGTTYVVGAVLTLTGGTGTAATFIVTGVTLGVVTTVAMLTPGLYAIVPANPVSTTGGGANNCTLTVTWADGTDIVLNDLLFGKGFADAANNGLHVAKAGATAYAVPVAENLATAATQTGIISRVGFQFAADDLDVDASGTLPVLTTAAKNLTTLGLVPGEWIFVGGDTAGTSFTTAANNGFKRVKSVATNAIVIDKSDSAMVTEVSAGAKTLRVFLGRVLKNETGTGIVRRSYNLERTLGAPDDSIPSQVQAEYLTGSVPSELTLNVATADKINADLKFVSGDFEQVSGVTGVKTGSRPDIEEADAFNTSSDFARIRLAIYDGTNEAPTALFAFVQEMTLAINNNLSPAKAVGVAGAFEVTAGTFAVSGSMTAYFSDVAAVEAVRANEDITLDFVVVKANAGIAVDVPLVALGDGRATVEKDAPITLPLTNEAASGAGVDANLNHTLLMVFFDYLPDAAA